jgi:long-chain acyl-CoA synthetase
MEKIWLKSYAPGLPETINPDVYQSIPEMFDQSVKKYADLPAYSNYGKTITYAEVDKYSQQFASYLQNHTELKPGDRIAIQMPNCLQYPIVLFGALRAGMVVVNTNPLYTPREMEHQFKDSGAKAVVIIANFASLLEQVLPQTDIKTVVITELGDMLGFPKSFIVNAVVKYVKKMVPAYKLPNAVKFSDAIAKGATKPFRKVEIKNHDIAFLQYTGGTTGVSKGAMLTHRNVIANTEQIYACLKLVYEEGKETIITALPLYHIFALVVNCLAVFKVGGHSILITNPRDMAAFVKDLAKYPFTMMTGVNTLYNGLLNNEDFRKLDFSKLKASVGGGTAVQKATSDRWRELTGQPIIEGYGLTESSPVLTVNPLGDKARIGTIGMPVPSTDVKLVDDQGNEITAQNTPGEICGFGPQIMKGYWNRPEATAEVIKDGWLYTGDIGVWLEDGFLKIVDRKKEMILVSGFNVYPNEIEDVIAECPGVLECAAIGVPDERSGEVPKVFVVKKDPNLKSDYVLDFARERLTAYKVPKYVEFRTELPKTNVGKILRRVLKEEEMARLGKHTS